MKRSLVLAALLSLAGCEKPGEPPRPETTPPPALAPQAAPAAPVNEPAGGAAPATPAIAPSAQGAAPTR